MYTFAENVTINDNFEVIGLINGVDIFELNTNVMRLDTAQDISTQLILLQGKIIVQLLLIRVGGTQLYVVGMCHTDFRLAAAMKRN